MKLIKMTDLGDGSPLWELTDSEVMEHVVLEII